MVKKALTGFDLLSWIVAVLRQTPTKRNDITFWQQDADAYVSQRASPAINLIEAERLEQFEKHGYTLQDDRQHVAGELEHAALFAITGAANWWPDGWDLGTRNKIGQKPLQERLVIAAALLAAEIDRLLAAEHLGGAHTSRTPAELLAWDSLQGQMFERTLVQLAAQSDKWAEMLVIYRTGVKPQPTAAQRLGEEIQARLANVPTVDGMDIALLADAAVDGINYLLAHNCPGNCGDNYCDENGCVMRKRYATELIPPATNIGISQAEETPET